MDQAKKNPLQMIFCSTNYSVAFGFSLKQSIPGSTFERLFAVGTKRGSTSWDIRSSTMFVITSLIGPPPSAAPSPINST